MSRFVYGVRPALFDALNDQVEKSLENEIERIVTSRLLSKAFEGICSDFGLPVFYSAFKEQKSQIQYEIAYSIMKFEPRLEKVTVVVESIQNGEMKVSLEVFPHFQKEASHIQLTLRL